MKGWKFEWGRNRSSSDNVTELVSITISGIQHILHNKVQIYGISVVGLCSGRLVVFSAQVGACTSLVGDIKPGELVLSTKCFL